MKEEKYYHSLLLMLVIAAGIEVSSEYSTSCPAYVSRYNSLTSADNLINFLINANPLKKMACQPKLHAKVGRIDMILKLPKQTYIIE